MLYLVGIEGPDLSGKTTIANLLLERLRELQRWGVLSDKVSIRKIEAPSKLITGYCASILFRIKDSPDPRVTALIFAADHLNLELNVFRRLEASNEVILMIQERSLLSYFVYQGLIQKVDVNWLRTLIKDCKRRPDITFVLKIGIKKLMERKKLETREFDVMEAEEQLRVQLATFNNLPRDLLEEFNVHYVDAERDLNDVVNEIASLTVKHLPEQYKA